jgi:hypothetical protein
MDGLAQLLEAKPSLGRTAFDGVALAYSYARLYGPTADGGQAELLDTLGNSLRLLHSAILIDEGLMTASNAAQMLPRLLVVLPTSIERTLVAIQEEKAEN